LHIASVRCDAEFGPPLELPHIDDAAAMDAIADLAVAVPGLDLLGISATK
jgi:hypothetical protein